MVIIVEDVQGLLSSVPLTYALSQGGMHVLLYDVLR